MQVGNPYSDHECWQRPEEMDTPRTAYKVDASQPGSDVAGETAAALAAASLAFAKIDKPYSKTLLAAAKKVLTILPHEFHLNRHTLVMRTIMVELMLASIWYDMVYKALNAGCPTGCHKTGRCLRLRISTEASTVMRLEEWCVLSTAPTTATK